jgi:hypothetical protein
MVNFKRIFCLSNKFGMYSVVLQQNIFGRQKHFSHVASLWQDDGLSHMRPDKYTRVTREQGGRKMAKCEKSSPTALHAQTSDRHGVNC